MTGKPPFEAVVADHGPTVLRVCRAVLGVALAQHGPAYPQHRRAVVGDDGLEWRFACHVPVLR